MLIKLTIVYDNQPSVSVRVPDMGLTPRHWAEAVFQATNAPDAYQYGTPGAREVDRALRAGRQSRFWRRGLTPGDSVEVLGKRVRCVDVQGRGSGASPIPTFAEAELVQVPLGPAMYVSADAPPPDAVAYVEDARDRLWTGRGHGEWVCLTDPAGRAAPGLWGSVWREHGPLVPLVPVDVLSEPVGEELASGPHRSGRPMELPAF